MKFREEKRKKEMRTDKIAISQTIQNHKNAIYDLAAIVEGLEVRWNDVRGYYSYVPSTSLHLPSFLFFPPFMPAPDSFVLSSHSIHSYPFPSYSRSWLALLGTRSLVLIL